MSDLQGPVSLSLANPPSHTELRRLCNDIGALGPSVHADILRHVNATLLTTNGNGVFFDMADLDSIQLANVRGVVDYAKGMRARLEEHDRKLFENSQQLVSGPIDTTPDADSQGNGGGPPSGGTGGMLGPVEGEEAFAVRMERGCISKPAKGVFAKK